MKARLEIALTKEEDAAAARPPPAKTTVLGAHQAKRRLQAFSSLLKQNALFGSAKKAVDKEKKSKKGWFNELPVPLAFVLFSGCALGEGKKPQATLIEEIEQLKRQEHEYLLSLKEKVQAKISLNETRAKGKHSVSE